MRNELLQALRESLAVCPCRVGRIGSPREETVRVHRSPVTGFDAHQQHGAPRQSHVEAISDRREGVITVWEGVWKHSFGCLAGEPGLWRRHLGACARATVGERCATAVLARRYLELLASLAS